MCPLLFRWSFAELIESVIAALRSEAQVEAPVAPLATEQVMFVLAIPLMLPVSVVLKRRLKARSACAAEAVNSPADRTARTRAMRITARVTGFIFLRDFLWTPISVPGQFPIGLVRTVGKPRRPGRLRQ